MLANFAPCADLRKIGSKSLNICCDKDTLFQCTSLPDANPIFPCRAGREREREMRWRTDRAEMMMMMMWAELIREDRKLRGSE